MSVITIIGAGMMGSAMSFPARDNVNEVRLVGTPLDREIINHAIKTGEHITLKRKLPSGIKYYQTEDMKTALEGADLLIGGISSFGVDWFCENVLSVIPQTLPVLSITKGMMDTPEGELIPYPHLYAQKVKRNLSLSAVGGPCTSYELADHDQTTVAFCGDDIHKLREFKGMLETDYYHISLSTDVVGVECAVAMKNAYALGVTLAVGLSQQKEGTDGKLHYNSQAALFGQSVKEMRTLLKLCGGRDENIIFGAGDLYVTVFGGRTRFIGTLLGRGISFEDAMKELSGITLESIVISTRTARAVRALIKLNRADEKDFPLLMHIDELINGGKKIDIPWNKFETETII